MGNGVYITKSNSMRILRPLVLKDVELEGMLYKVSISMFNRFEEKVLLAFQMLMENPKEFVDKIYSKCQKRKDNLMYVYEADNAPAYHLYLHCEKLNSKYDNFEIPKEIISEEERIEFRRWFKDNSYLLDQNKNDVFDYRLSMRFNVKNPRRPIAVENSGRVEIYNWNLEQLEEAIDSLLNQAYMTHGGIIRKYEKMTFLAYQNTPLKYNNTDYNDNDLKEIIKEFDEKYKKRLIFLLRNYYRVKYNPDLKMQGSLLDQLGFSPCCFCCKNLDQTACDKSNMFSLEDPDFEQVQAECDESNMFPLEDPDVEQAQIEIYDAMMSYEDALNEDWWEMKGLK